MEYWDMCPSSLTSKFLIFLPHFRAAQTQLHLVSCAVTNSTACSAYFGTLAPQLLSLLIAWISKYICSVTLNYFILASCPPHTKSWWRHCSCKLEVFKKHIRLPPCSAAAWWVGLQQYRCRLNPFGDVSSEIQNRRETNDLFFFLTTLLFMSRMSFYGSLKCLHNWLSE